MSSDLQHFILRLTSFPPAGKEKEKPRTFLPCHPPLPHSSTALHIYMQILELFEEKALWTPDSAVIDCREAGGVAVKKERSRWMGVLALEPALSTTHVHFCSRAPFAFEDIPVRGGWAADCSEPDSAARRSHGCCRPGREGGDEFNDVRKKLGHCSRAWINKVKQWFCFQNRFYDV